MGDGADVDRAARRWDRAGDGDDGTGVCMRKAGWWAGACRGAMMVGTGR